MNRCDDPCDPVKMKQCIKEINEFVDGREHSPYTPEEIKAIGTPAPKAKIACERKPEA